MADIILLIALIIHYYYFTRRARAIAKAWRHFARLLAVKLDQPPPPIPGFEPRGLDEPDLSSLRLPALASLRQKIGQWTGMPPHPLRGLSATLEFGPYRRRVRLLSLTDDPDQDQRLDFFCFERGAIRRFPVARLARIIDPAGEAHDGRSFIDTALDLRRNPGPSLMALEGVAQGATLLIAAALQQDALNEDAQQIITDFAHETARAASYRQTDPLVQRLDAHVLRLRPDPRLVEEAVSYLLRQQDPDHRRLLAVLRRLDPAGVFNQAYAAIEAALDRPKPW